MKRKIVASIIVIALLMIISLSLFACDDPTSRSFKFSEDMTIEEIENAIGQFKSFTIETPHTQMVDGSWMLVDTQEENLVYYFGENIINDCGYDPNSGVQVNHVRVYEFWEDGVYYVFQPGVSQYKKVNATKEEFDNYIRFGKENSSWSMFWYGLENGDYAIIDGKLCVGKLANADDWCYTMRDMNKTKVKLPSEFSDYKTREFT